MAYRQLLFQKAEAALIEEKASKLSGLACILDNDLEDDFITVLERCGVAGAPREQRIAALNSFLSPITEELSRNFKGVGVGYYAQCVDSFVACAPQCRFGDQVGTGLRSNHIGWQAMRRREEMLSVGSMAGADTIGWIKPLLRRGEVIGFAWAGEPMEDVYRQLANGGQRFFFAQEGVEPMLGITGMLILAIRYTLWAEQLRERMPEPANKILELGPSLEQIQHYVRLFLNTLEVGVLVEDCRGQVLFYNRSMERLAEELGVAMRGDVFNALGLPGMERVFTWMRQRQVKYVPLQVTLAPDSPCRRQASLVAALIAGWRPGEEYRICFLEDLTRLQQDDERWWRAVKLGVTGEMAAAIAHEIRNPLTIINSSIKLLPDKLDDREFIERLSRVVGGEISRINRTVEALLSLARVTELQLTSVNIKQLLDETVGLIENYASSAGVVIERHYGAEPLLVRGDRQRLREALLNLMVNAVQAMPGGGRLEIDCRCEASSNLVQVIIKDTGIGIAAEAQPKIFEPFYTTKKDGVGLGLALVYRVIDEHQGFIQVESESGRGSIFTVTLPVQHYVFNEEPDAS